MSGGIFKDKLIYDATTPGDGDSVAAFLRTGAGALTSTGAAGALDVNITNAITVDLNGVYDAGTNPTPDTAGSIFHTRAAAPDETNQTFRATGGTASADGVTAANVQGLDVNSFLMGFNGTTWDRLTATGGALNVVATGTVTVTGGVADDGVDSGNPIKVGSRAVSGALTALSASGDRADLLSDLYRRVWVNTAPNIAGSNAAVSIDDTAGGTAVFASPLAGRRRVMVQNQGSKPIYLGFGTVTAANGTQVNAKATWTEELGPDIALKAIAEAGQTNDVRVFQLA